MQRQAIREASKRLSLPLERIEEDDAVSGDATNRKGLLRALAALRKGGPGSTLIVRELSRLGRDSTDLLETGRALIDGGIRVICLAEGIDTALPDGQHRFERELGMRAWFIEEEKRTIVERLWSGRMAAKAKGRKYGSEAPYGQRVDAEGNLVADEVEQRGLARMRELHGQGLSLSAIGVALAGEGIFPRHGLAWSKSTLTYILRGRPKRKPRGTSRAKRSDAFWARVEA